MKKVFKPGDYDVVFISYDEPNADENWYNLSYIIPKAKRIKNIKGIADGYRAAGNLATTDHVLTVDGDTQVYDKLFRTEFTINTETNNYVCSWNSLNSINGLKYANGGVKLWPTELVRNLQTHEYAPPTNIAAQIDYQGGNHSNIYMPPSHADAFSDVMFATTCIHGSPLQAWRAAFREGVKLGLDQGIKVEELRRVWPGLLHMLTVWATIGADVENGLWAILGARQGCYMTHFTEWDIRLVRDFSYLNGLFDTIKNFTDEEILAECSRLGKIINQKFDICEPFSATQSKTLKGFNIDPERMLISQIMDYDKYKSV